MLLYQGHCSQPESVTTTAVTVVVQDSLFLGGDKTGDTRFYRRYVPLADKLYDEHLRELKEEGLIK